MTKAALVASDPAESCRHEAPLRTCACCRWEFKRSLLQWSSRNFRSYPWRRRSRSSFTLVVAEVLLQQTSADKVREMWPAFVGRYGSWRQLSAANGCELEEILRPLGLYRRKARALVALADAVCALGGVPRSEVGLAELPGIGQYTSRAVVIQLTSASAAPIDVNVARVLERVFGPRKLADLRYDSGLQRLGARLFSDGGSGLLFAFLDLAAKICTARRPACGQCPIKACRFRAG